MTKRILGIDPGLTRCGVGVVDVGNQRNCALVHVGVVRTDVNAELSARLCHIGDAVEQLLDEYRPETVSIERVFAETRNLNTVMGVAQITGIVLREAQKRGLSTELHTPSEVKAAVSGYGRADKQQVQEMVRRILKLEKAPKPADAADALALAICAGFQTPIARLAPQNRNHGSLAAATGRPKTSAQQAWLAAEAAAKGRRH